MICAFSRLAARSQIDPNYFFYFLTIMYNTHDFICTYFCLIRLVSSFHTCEPYRDILLEGINVNRNYLDPVLGTFSPASKFCSFVATWLCYFLRCNWLIFKDPILIWHRVHEHKKIRWLLVCHYKTVLL